MRRDEEPYPSKDANRVSEKSLAVLRESSCVQKHNILDIFNHYVHTHLP